MKKIVIEVIGTHNCRGYQASIPELVNDFCTENHIEIDFKAYQAWDITTAEKVPAYIRQKLEEMKNGEISNSGFFLNASWIPWSPHSPQDSVDARNALTELIGKKENHFSSKTSGIKFDKNEFKGSIINKLSLIDCDIKSISTFCSTFEKVSLFDGNIKELAVHSLVEKFHFRGYDILKLLEIAKEHPDIFNQVKMNYTFDYAKMDDRQPKDEKIDISEISFAAKTIKNLEGSRHPCVITGGHIISENKPYTAAAERIGIWGYEAKYKDLTCGFLGIMPKDIAQRDAYSFIPPPFSEPEKTLLITCFAGGGVFGAKFSDIGIATGMVNMAIQDAKKKNFNCIEANPHDLGIFHVLEKCGFKKVPWKGGGRSSLRDQAFYRIIL